MSTPPHTPSPAATPHAATPHAAYASAFAVARMLRELARDVHGNLAAIGVAPLSLGDAAIAAEFEAVGGELNAIALQLVELRERSAAIAEAHLAKNAAKLKPKFGYRVTSREGVKQVTTPAPETV